MSDDAAISKPSHFIKQIIEEDVAAGLHGGRVVTRFPPEPNGYLHIGSAKAIWINFSLANDFGGQTHLRMDDTNPEAEDVEYEQAIIEDIKWLGYDWGDHLYFASDYYEQIYEAAVKLIKDGKAYVCDLDQETWNDYRRTPTEPGRLSPYRDRSVEENLDLFARMRAGEFEDGHCVLRAKIDMNSSNIHMRDPALYRIKRAIHHRTGDAWVIYPMYDFAHPLSDAIEGITHSLCSLEFENHRPLYDWVIEHCEVFPSKQREFARLNINYVVMSKRYLRALVEEGRVSGWDDPRMPTLRGMRRRGYTPDAIKHFLAEVGVTKFNSLSDYSLLEHHVRQDLNKKAPRVMGVLDPVKLVITNYPEGQVEEMDAVNNPEEPEAGTRKVPFSRELFIERDDFMEDPPKKFFRMGPGREVRLKYAYYVTCTDFIKDESGKVIEIHATYDPESRGGGTPDNRKVKGTIHWVSAEKGIRCETRIYDRLFCVEEPLKVEEGANWHDGINPESVQTIEAVVEPSLAEAEPGVIVQFERKGYFCVDSVDSQPGKPVFNRTVALRDSWGKGK